MLPNGPPVGVAAPVDVTTSRSTGRSTGGRAVPEGDGPESTLGPTLSAVQADCAGRPSLTRVDGCSGRLTRADVLGARAGSYNVFGT
jgi:hypothetical protein